MKNEYRLLVKARNDDKEEHKREIDQLLEQKSEYRL